MTHLDKLVAYHTAFYTFEDMVQTSPNYRPSLASNSTRDKKENQELNVIADAYDKYMRIRGDSRRVYRF